MTNTDVVKKLIGPVKPYGDSGVDAARTKNLHELLSLVDDLIDEIRDVAKEKDRYEASMKSMGLAADKFLQELKNNL
jgi:hypothetical protein